MDTYTSSNKKLTKEQDAQNNTVRIFLTYKFSEYYGYKNDDKMGNTYSTMVGEASVKSE
jgi:hypothetical protein